MHLIGGKGDVDELEAKMKDSISILVDLAFFFGFVRSFIGLDGAGRGKRRPFRAINFIEMIIGRSVKKRTQKKKKKKKKKKRLEITNSIN